MSARAKIESLTNTWYGFAVFSAVTSVLINGIGFFSLAGAAFWLFASFALTFFIGRALLAKSSLTRFLLLCISGFFTVSSAVATGKLGLNFIANWELATLATMALTAVNTWMHARSFKTLTDSSVKSYFN